MEKPSRMGVVAAFDLEHDCGRKGSFRDVKMPVLPKALTLEEKKFLLAVERGDLASVKRIFQRVKRGLLSMDLNCVDPLGRGALLMAIDNENLPMVELLVVLGISTRDALLHAIDKEFVEAVELLLEHEELIHKEGEPYSWEKVDQTTSSFTPDITPLVLAAHRNNYEILKILLDRGATLPTPHDVRCGCEECIRGVLEDSLRHSMSRINAYRALSSPSLIALSSTDPILSAFELSAELKRLAYVETEFRQEYMELRRQCQQFACDLLSHTRSSTELAVLLNHDPSSNPSLESSQQNLNLTRLELAIDYKQKKFVAHPNIQQLLASIWYEGLPGFRRKSPLQKMIEIALIAFVFPVYCLLYLVAPWTAYAQLMRKPFMKFLIHASSYLFFLFLLILVSQRFDVLVVEFLGTESMRRNLEDQLRRQRGNGPTALECVVAFYVLGYIFEEVREMWKEGLRRYFANMWNVIDICRDTAYSLVIVLRVVAYYQQQRELLADPASAYLPREEWDDFDPQLISEGVCAMANIFSALKLVHLFSINPYLGPLQISLGRMVIDIIKFFFIYTLVLFAFACGLNQLLWYFSDLERQKCHTLPGGLADWNKNPEACLKWRRFANLFESTQSLFWASFGLVDLSNFELTGVRSYTRFWSMLIFGSYSVINVVVLLNLLIAMMSNSYSLITEHSDTEWKFARSKLWMSYFDEGSNTLPPPFNLFPSPKNIVRILGRLIRCNFTKSSASSSNGGSSKFRRSSNGKQGRQARLERDYRYAAVTRSLVWRYVTTMHRLQDLSEVTEDDINEVKGDISTLRFELLEVFKNNGMDISSANKNTKTAQGRKMRIWERRLLRDFQVVSLATGDDEEQETEGVTAVPPKTESGSNGADNFRRLASVAVAINAAGTSTQPQQQFPAPSTRQPARLIKSMSQIGKSMSSESFQSSQNLRRAMEEAQRLAIMAPTPELSPKHGQASSDNGTYSPSPLPIPPDSGARVLELLRSMSNHGDEDEGDEENLSEPRKQQMNEDCKRHDEMNLAVTGRSSQDQSPTSLPWLHQRQAEPMSSSLPAADPERLNCSWKPAAAVMDIRPSPFDCNPLASPPCSTAITVPTVITTPFIVTSSNTAGTIRTTTSAGDGPAVDETASMPSKEDSLPKRDINSFQLPVSPPEKNRGSLHFSGNSAENDSVSPSSSQKNDETVPTTATSQELVSESRPMRFRKQPPVPPPLVSSPISSDCCKADNLMEKEVAPFQTTCIVATPVDVPEVIQEGRPASSDKPLKHQSSVVVADSAECVDDTPIKRVDNVKTIKRQPSAGWL